MEVRRIGPEGGLIREIKELRGRVSRQETRPAGNIVIRETLTTTDPLTGVSTTIGQLPDGSYGFQPFIGDIVPPPVATTPIISSQPGYITVAWDGLFVNNEEQPRDFQYLNVWGHKMSGTSTVYSLVVGAIRLSSDTIIVTQDFAAIGETWQFSFESEDYNGNRSARSNRSADVTMTSAVTDDGVNAALAEINQDVLSSQSAAASAQSAADKAQKAADDAAKAVVDLGSITGTIYTQSATPSANSNSLWIDTAHNNVPRRYLGKVNRTALVANVGGGASIGSRLTSLGYSVSAISVMPTFAQASAYDVVAFDAGYAGLSSAYNTLAVQLLDRGVSIFTSGNDTTSLPYLFTGGANRGTPKNPIRPTGTHPAAQGWAQYSDVDLNFYLTGVDPNATVTGVTLVGSVDQPLNIVREHPTTFARWVHVETYATPVDAINAHLNWVFDNWVVVQDQGIISAASAAASAQSKADQAFNNAASAATAAGNAQTTADGKNRVWYQTTPPSGTGNKVGDTWFDTGNGYKIYVWDGSAWKNSQDTGIAAAQNTANTKTKTYFQSTSPALTGNTLGDIWFDTSNGNKPAVWNGSAWANAQDSGITAAQSTANTALTSANGKNKTYSQPTAPSGGTYIAGDTWFDTSNGNKIYIYSGSAWVSAQDTAIGTAQNTANTAVTTANSKTKTYFQSASPALTGNTAGDTWFDTGNGNKIYVWNGSSWVNAQDAAIGTAQSTANTALTSANGKNKIYYQGTQPSGGTYIAGDTWFDTSNGNKIYVYNGSAWAVSQDTAIGAAQSTANTANSTANSALTTANSKTKTYFQSTSPAVTGNTNGDIWFDTGNGNKTYVWNGSAWTSAQDTAIAAAQSSANGKNRIYYQTSQPTGGTYIAGDTWFDTSNGNKIYVYSGSAWVSAQDASIATAQSTANTAQTAANTAQTTANAKTTTFTQSTAPSATGRTTGDIWFDTSNGNKPMVWNGSAWVSAQDASIAAAQSTANSAQTAANGKNTVFYQTTAPSVTGRVTGDTWFDTANGYRISVWNGSAWTLSQDATIATAQSTANSANTAAGNAQTTANNALSTANSKTKTYFQSTQPAVTGNTTGDTWFDTGNGNKTYVWNGTAWTLAQDAAITAAQTSANGKNTIYYQSTSPAVTGRVTGDTWFDTGNGYKIYVWNGSAWTASQDTAIAAAQSAANTANTTANSKTKTFIQGTAPTASTVGDIWIDTANGNVIKTWEGSSWVNRADTAISSAQTTANNALTSANGKNRTYYQTTQPSGGTYILGDTWFDTSNGYKIYVYNGTTWVASQDAAIAAAQSTANTANTTANSKTKTFVQGTAPTASTVGDIWIDTANGNVIKTWEGSSWVTRADAAIAAAQNAANAAQTSANGKNTNISAASAPATAGHIVGDLWFDTSNGNKPMYFNGTTWVSAQDAAIATAQSAANAAQTTANSKTKTFTQGTAPTASTVGDIWIDTANGNVIKVWDGSAWITRADAAIAAAQSAANTAQTTANGKNTVISAASAPATAGRIAGDIWFDTSNGNKPMVFSGTAWVSAQDASISTAQSTANSKTKTFIQGTAPTATTVGDIWIDTANGNVIKTWEGSAWVTRADAAIAAAQSAANAAQTSANGKNTNISAATAPATAGHIVGDLWFDTSNGNKPMYFNGSAWVSAQDASIATAQSAANTAQTTANGKNTATYSSSAASGSGTRIGDIWFQTNASNIIIGQWQWNGSAWIQQTIDNAVIANLDAGKITAGYIAAARIQAGTITSTMIATDTITAGNIASGAITASELAAGSVQAQHLTANSVSATAIVANTITASQIAGGTITASQIATDTITAGNIASGAITASELAAGSVQAQHLTANSVSATSMVANTITAGQIAGGTITAAQIATDTITAGNIAAGAITASELSVGSVQAQHLTASAISATAIAADSITSRELAAGSITAAKGQISDLAVTTAKIADTAITNAKIADATIQSAKIGSVDAGTITVGTLNAARIGANSINASKLIVGDTEEFIPNPFFHPSGQPALQGTIVATNSLSVSAGAPYPYALQLASRDNHPFDYPNIPVKPGDQFYLEVWVATTTATRNFNLYMFGSTTPVGSLTATVSTGNIAPTSTWTKVSWNYTVPANATYNYIRPVLQINTVGGETAAQLAWYATGFSMRRKNTGNLIVDGAIQAGSAIIGTGAIGTAQIGNLAVTSAQIGNQAVGTAQIADLSVGTAKIQDTAITNAKIANLDAGKITTGTLDANRIGADTITATHIASDAITANELAANSITAAKGQLSDLAVTNAKIADLAVTNAKIADATIASAKIAQLDAGKITTGTLDANRIGANSLAANKIFVGDFTNLAADGKFTDLNKVNWQGSGTVMVSAGNPNMLKVITAASGNNDQANLNTFQVVSGEQIYGEMWVYGETTNVGNGGPNLHLAVSLNDGTTQWPTFQSLSRAAVQGAWTKLSGKVTIPANAKSARVEPAVSFSADAVGNTYYFREISVRRMATGSLIVDGAITAGSAIIQTGAIGSAQIADLAVGTAEIADTAITNAKIANLAVGTAQIQDTAITNAKIANLDAGKITTGTLDANRIGADTITSTHIATDAITANELAANSITAAKGQIADLTITTAKIQDTAITSAKIANLAVGTAQIQDTAITNAKIANLDAGKITTGTLDANRIGANTVTADKLLVGDFENLATINEVQGITVSSYGQTMVSAGYNKLVNDSGQFFMFKNQTGPVPFKNGERLYYSFTAKATAATTATLGVYIYNAALSNKSSSTGTFNISTTDTPVTGSVVVPSSDATFGPAYQWVVGLQNVSNKGIQIKDVVVRRMNGGELLVDGTIQAGSAIIANGAIGNAQIGSLAVGTAQIQDTAITNAKIGLLAVDTAQIKDGAVTNLKVSNLDAAKITTGTLDANRIGANTITTAKLAVGDFTDLVDNGTFESDFTNWTVSGATITTTAPYSGTKSAYFSGGNSIVQERPIPVTAGDKFVITAWYKTSADKAGVGGIRLIDQAGAEAATYSSSYDFGVSTTYIKHQIIATVKAGVTAMRPRIAFALTAGNVTVDNYSIRRQTGAVFIEDGAIQAGSAIIGTGAIGTAQIGNLAVGTAQIADTAITNAKIADATIQSAKIGSVDAGTITVGTLSAARLASKSITADKLVISSTDNLIVEADFGNNGSSWGTLNANKTINATAGRGGLPALRVTGSTALQSVTNLANKVTVGSEDRFRGSFYIKSSVAAASGVAKLRMNAYTTATANTSVVVATSPAVSANTWTLVEGYSPSLPANTIAVEFVLDVQNAATGTVTDIDYVAMTRAADGRLVVDGAIDGKTITGALIRTAATNNRVQLDTTGLRAFDALGNETVTISGLDGTISATGQLSAYGKSKDWWTNNDVTVRAVLGNRIARNTWVGYDFLQPGVYFERQDGVAQTLLQTPRLISSKTYSIGLESGHVYKTQTKPNEIRASGIGADPNSASMGSSLYDKTINEDGSNGLNGILQHAGFWTSEQYAQMFVEDGDAIGKWGTYSIAVGGRNKVNDYTGTGIGGQISGAEMRITSGSTDPDRSFGLIRVDRGGILDIRTSTGPTDGMNEVYIKSDGSGSLSLGAGTGAIFLQTNSVATTGTVNAGKYQINGVDMSAGEIQAWTLSASVPNNQIPVYRMTGFVANGAYSTSTALGTPDANGIKVTKTGVYDIHVAYGQSGGVLANSRNFVEIGATNQTSLLARSYFSEGEDSVSVAAAGVVLNAGDVVRVEVLQNSGGSKNFTASIRLKRVAAPVPVTSWEEGNITHTGTHTFSTGGLQVAGRNVSAVRHYQSTIVTSYPPNSTLWGPGLFTRNDAASINGDFVTIPTNDQFSVTEAGVYEFEFQFWLRYTGGGTPKALFQQWNGSGWDTLAAVQRPENSVLWEFQLQRRTYAAANSLFRLNFAQNSGASQTWDTQMMITKIA